MFSYNATLYINVDAGSTILQRVGNNGLPVVLIVI